MQSTFLAWIFRMPLIQRWSLMHCVKQENVAEHSHQVAVVAHLLAVIRNKKFGGSLNPDRAATIALYHEASEPFCGDLSSNIKYDNPLFTREFKNLEAAAEQQCLSTLPEEFQEVFEDLVIQKQVDPEYAAIVKAADVLCAYIKTLDELNYNNQEFDHVKVNLERRMASLRGMPEVEYFMNTFMQSCVTTLDQLTGRVSPSAGRPGAPQA